MEGVINFMRSNHNEGIAILLSIQNDIIYLIDFNGSHHFYLLSQRLLLAFLLTLTLVLPLFSEWLRLLLIHRGLRLLSRSTVLLNLGLLGGPTLKYCR